MASNRSNIASLPQEEPVIPKNDNLAAPQDPHAQYIDGPATYTKPRYITRQLKRRAIAGYSSESSAKRSKVKRKQGNPVPAIDELPHNLGKIEILDAVVVGSAQGFAVSTVPQLHSTDSSSPPTPYEAVTSRPRRNHGPKNPYGLTPGVSPFPDWKRPTVVECEEVNRLLSSVHGEVRAPKAIPPPSLTVSGCGEVPSILDALIRTLLSGATTGNNSAMAFQGLVRKFGILKEGIGKGSVDWNKVREAPVEDIYEAMKCGGLGVAKSKYIKQILEMVYEENKARRDALIESKTGKNLDLTRAPGSINETEEQKDNEIAMTNEHVLSLNHLHSLSKDEAMLEFVKYPGIGVKTAACVVLFCLQRPCFAVDTHVFRLSKWLGWIPPDKVNEITAFSHLEVKIPDHLKYSLHQLFIRHGKACPRCRAITTENSQGWEAGCIIDHLVQRTGKRKGGPLKQTKLSFQVNKPTYKSAYGGKIEDA
ncbi:HhH-GPD family base excision DNA repair protein [Trichophyton tonsurans CBS 112818]|uniref:HhH-GPD superfamily base excision DNA repair protein n=2 Tax=Trichophyton TaxID=5550 RepID=F2PZW5_TRIEC|nr:HhH-GPD family base excision DNA repair protein [Trichophyton tonsurans CBS 112818]EGE07433.1 HhH-GPD superfamily base excision DNA repair protein [Trichophyton equinum CBS 127.97]